MVEVKLEKKKVSGIMLTLLLLSMLMFAFSVSHVGALGPWVWVRDTVTGAYGEAVVGTDMDIYIARGNSFYRYRPWDNSFVELAAPPQPDGYAFKTGTALAWSPIEFDYIYALYGAATGESRRFFYRYSISSDSWERLPDTPVDQGEGDTITWAFLPVPRLYATIGGEQRPTYFMAFEPCIMEWNPFGLDLADPPGGMGDGASLVWTEPTEYLYALRGEFLETEPLYDFWRYDLMGNVWTAMADIPAWPHSGGSGGVGDGGSLLYISELQLPGYGDYIYALSGNQAHPDGIPDNRFYRYTISTNTWERLADLPFGVGYYVGSRLAYADGNIYAWQGTPSTWTGGGDDLAKYQLTPPPWGDWNHYHNYTEIVNTLLYLNDTYPNIVDVFSIGKSWQNKDIYTIRLTNESNTHPKPKLLFVGYHHARELISAELPLYFAVQAATKFGVNETITHMLNYSEIYIIPALNIDAFEAVSQNEWQRKNVHPFDEDNDGLLDEDPPDDEDGDGYIEDLFYWDGTNYYFIRWEGIDDDSDGLQNEDWVGGVDLNRNYGYQWNATCQSGSPYPWAEDCRGPEPFSEPETQAIRDLAMANNFKYAISFHSGTEVIGYPWGYTTEPTPDDAKFQEIASNLSALTGAPYGQNSGLYTASGMWDDWMYQNRSTFAFTCEIYTNETAWQYEPGPEPNTYWEKGVFQYFNPDPNQIETVIQRWLPAFTYMANRAIKEAYNIAITNVMPLKTVVGQGYSMNVNVTVVNKGDFTETFDVTLYANTTAIETREITLESTASTTITYTWNTGGFVKGNYSIWAYAWPVLGETDVEDNTFVDGWIIVAMVGDINVDGIVDIEDIYNIALHYGTMSGQPDYSPNLDINNDGIIDIEDIYTTALHYGEIDP
jgi:hypothetical protein